MTNNVYCKGGFWFFFGFEFQITMGVFLFFVFWVLYQIIIITVYYLLTRT